MTEYRDVPGYAGYRVSADGQVQSARVGGTGQHLSSIWHTLKPMLNPSTGYLTVHLRGANGKRRKVEIHNLVLLAWVGPKPAPYYQACHGNGDRTDNRLTNLRWDTPRGNQQDSVRHGTKSRGEKVATKLTTPAVIALRRRFAAGERAFDLAAEYGISFQTVYKVVNRDLWAHIPDDAHD